MNLSEINLKNTVAESLSDTNRTVLKDEKYFYKIFKTYQTKDFLFSIYNKNFKSNDFFCGRYLIRDCSLQYFKEKDCLISFELGYLNASIAPAFCDVLMHNGVLVGYKTYRGNYDYSIQQFYNYIDLLVDYSFKKNIILPDVTKENIASVNNMLSIIDFSDAVLEIPVKKTLKFYDFLQYYLENSDNIYSDQIKLRLNL